MELAGLGNNATMKSFTTLIVGLLIGLCIGWYAGHVGISCEHRLHRNSMKKMEQVLTNGDIPTVLRALQTYNSIAATDSTYRAASEMNDVIYQLKH